MNMPAEYCFDLGKTVNDLEKNGGILQRHPVHPGAPDGERVVMQRDQCVAIGVLLEIALEYLQLCAAEVSAFSAGHRRIEHDDYPII